LPELEIACLSDYRLVSFLFNLTDISYLDRNKEYLEYIIRHAVASATVEMVIGWFPKMLKGIAARLILPDFIEVIKSFTNISHLSSKNVARYIRKEVLGV